MIKRAALLLLVMMAGAEAQTSPGLITGQVPTATNWNSYFAAKADVTGGTINNGTVSGTLGSSTSTGAFSSLTIGQSASPNYNGLASMFRFGYGATAPLLNVQSNGTDVTGSGQGAAAVSQIIDLAGGGANAAIGALTVGQTINGSPSTDYWAIASRAYIQNIADVSPPPGGSQHGAQFMHVIKNLSQVSGGTVPSGRKMPDAWNLWWVNDDQTKLVSSVSGAQVGLEFDFHGSNQDDASVRFARQVVLQSSGLQSAGFPSFEVKYGDYWNSHTGDGYDAFFDVVSAYYAGWSVAALDFSQGTGQRANPYVGSTNSAVTIKFADGANGSKLSWNGDGATGTYMMHQGGALQWWNSGAYHARLLDTGEIRVVSGVPISFDDGGVYNIKYSSSTNSMSFSQSGTEFLRGNSAGVAIEEPLGFSGTSAGAPATPSSGYRFYVDTSDGNKLKVIGQGGTVTTVALP